MKKEVPIEMKWEPSWLSWAGSVTTCLKALGVECCIAYVGGHSGYSFALSINEGICASGPTFLDWAALSSAIPGMGRSVMTYQSRECFTDDTRNERTLAHAKEAFELATREVEAGRPCVGWGLGIPEFGVIRGVEDEFYLCVPGGGIPERVKWDKLDAPGGPYLLTFPTPVKRLVNWDFDLESIRRAVMMLTRPNHGANMTCSLEAYDYWCEQLKAKNAIMWANSYNAQCWSEARAQATSFLSVIAKDHPKVNALISAQESFKTVFRNLSKIAEMFPFTMKFEDDKITDEKIIKTAVKHLQGAKEAESKAIEQLKDALKMWE